VAASVASAMEDDFEMEGEEETWSIVGLLTWPLRTVVKWIIMAMIKAATGGSPKGNIDKYADKLAKENLAKERELEREEIEALEKRSAIFRVLTLGRCCPGSCNTLRSRGRRRRATG